jgi:hypothetical protein
MPIQTYQDPTGEEKLFARGIVTGAYINEIPPEKRQTYSGKTGPWTPTVRYKLIVDGVEVGLGMGEKAQIRAKDKDGNYQDVAKGAEISVIVQANGEYNGKPQYKATTSDIKVLKVAPGDAASNGSKQGFSASNGGSAAQSFKPKDMSGVEAGQSLNGAMNFLLTYGVDPTNENIVEYGKKVHQATVQVKSVYKEMNPSVPEYDAGARCGLAVLTACKLVGTEQDFETGVINIAQDILTNVLEPITQYVKSPTGTQTAPKVSRVAPKKPVATKAKPVVKAAVQEADEEPDFSGEDDDSAPF